MENIYKLEYYVPTTHTEQVKAAIFATGAGKMGNYDCCAWQTTAGTGQFRPRQGSNPFIGKQDIIEYVAEVKVELICREGCIKEAVAALRQAHPYETPAFQYWEVNT